jgi:hypothetical protein
VNGLGDTPLQFSLQALRKQFQEQTITATLQCAANRLAGLTASVPHSVTDRLFVAGRRDGGSRRWIVPAVIFLAGLR